MKLNSEKLEVIEQKIAAKTQQLCQPTTFAGAKLLSRHEMDLEKAVTRDRDTTKVFSCLVTDKSTDSVDPDHPINHLDKIWKDILSSKPTCRRKRKRGAAVVADETASYDMSEKVIDSNLSEAAVSERLNHEAVCVKTPTNERPESSSSDHSKQKDVLLSKHTCRRRKRKRGAAVVTNVTAGCEVPVKVNDGIVSKAAVSKGLHHKDVSVKSLTAESSESLSSDPSKQPKCTVEPVPTEVIERYRLSVEQIKQLPRFQNYDAGVPSPV